MKRILLSLTLLPAVIFPSVSEAKAANAKSPVYKVVIDAGHGGHDPGAVGKNGSFEKNVTLSVALEVNRQLAKSSRIRPNLTRADDTFLSLGQRYDKANRLAADLFVSIHANEGKASTTGTESYFYHKNSSSLAGILQKHVRRATGFPDRGVKQAAFQVIKKTAAPAALIEIGFISNAKEENALQSPSKQGKIASAITAAIKEYLRIK